MRPPPVVLELQQVSEPVVHQALCEQAFRAVLVVKLDAEVSLERPEEREDQELAATPVLEAVQVD